MLQDDHHSESSEQSETTGLRVFAKGVYSACRVFVEEQMCQDYLTWMTPKLRRYYYQQTGVFGEGVRLFVEGLQLEHGVDIQHDPNSALMCYEKAAKLGNFMAECKRILLEKKLYPSKETDMPTQIARWLELGMEYVEDIRNSFVGQLLKFEPDDLNYLTNVVLAAKLSPDRQEVIMSLLAIAFKELREDSLQDLTRVRQSSFEREYLPGLRLYLAIMLEHRPFLESAEMEHVPAIIDFLLKKEFAPAYLHCGKMLHCIGMRKQALECFRKGWAAGDSQCLNWLIVESFSQMDIAANLTVVERLLPDYLLLVLHMNNDIYEVFFVHNYLKKHLVGYRNDLQEELLCELVKVVQHYQQLPPPKLMSLNSPAILITYLNCFRPKLQPEEQDARLMRLLKQVRGNKDQCRLLLYFLMKLRRRRRLNTELRLCEYQYVQLCRETVDEKEFPTAFYRYGKCVYKGYGVTASRASSYLLFTKVLQELDRRIKQPFELVKMSFVNYVCGGKARHYLRQLEQTKSVYDLQLSIRHKLEEERDCCVCMTNQVDALLFPCRHFCCSSCFNQLLHYKNSCPLCREMVFSLVLTALHSA